MRGKRGRGGMIFFFTAVLVLLSISGSVGYADTFIVTSGDDSGPGTLRQAIADAVSGDIIVFNLPDPWWDWEVYLFEPLTIDKNLTINGPGSDLLQITMNYSSSSAGRVFEISSGTEVTIDGLEIRWGCDVDYGGGILNNGTLTLTSCSIYNNGWRSDGGVAGGGLANFGDATVIGCVFEVNGATYASGGSEGGGGIYNDGEMDLINCTFERNIPTATAGPFSIRITASCDSQDALFRTKTMLLAMAAVCITRGRWSSMTVPSVIVPVALPAARFPTFRMRH